jgi:hypothetical protein
MSEKLRRFTGQEQDVVNPFYHQQRAARVAADVERFLAQGGQVTEVPSGVSGSDTAVSAPISTATPRGRARHREQEAAR